jgi:hypothetical protein
MKQVVFGAALGSLALAVGLAAPAKADLIFPLDVDFCTGGCGSAPFGTVTLHDVSTGDVHVHVALASGNEFVVTGAGHALSFGIVGDPSITIAGLTSGFARGPNNDKADGAGTFDYSVDCSVALGGCGKGGSKPNPGPLDFDVLLAGLTSADFTIDDKDLFFASDIISGTTGNTGVVGADGKKPPIPEPGTLAVFAAGLLGYAVVRRRKL